MKLFKANIKNNDHWVSAGALEADFYIHAQDIMSALVKADETLGVLREKLANHKSLDGLRIRSLHEVGDIVDGVVMERDSDIESWVERVARKAQEYAPS